MLFILIFKENQSCVAFNSNSRYLLTGGKSKILSVWDLKTKVVKKTYKVCVVRFFYLHVTLPELLDKDKNVSSYLT